MTRLFATLALIAAAINLSNAFTPQTRHFAGHHAINLSSANVEAPEAETSSTTTLNLMSEVTMTSEAAPSPNGKKLLDFFSLPDSAQLILRGSKNNQIVEISNPDASLIETYQQQCRQVNAKSPTADDKFFDVTTSGVDFPGLKVMSVGTIGVSIFVCEKGLPYYQFVLIKDSTFATGNRIFVWFFNKVTGKDKRKDNEASTQSLNVIRTISVGDDEIAFEANASLRVKVKFPSFLMKVIPNGKEKSEKSGGESLRKVLEADIPVALDGFRKEYMKWLES